MRVSYPRYSREELLVVPRERVRALSAVLPLERAVLFGSWAKGRATAFSDIDLLIVYSGPPRDDAYALTRRTVDLRGLEPHIYTAEQARSLAEKLDRMTRDAVTLFPA